MSSKGVHPEKMNQFTKNAQPFLVAGFELTILLCNLEIHKYLLIFFDWLCCYDKYLVTESNKLCIAQFFK